MGTTKKPRSGNAVSWVPISTSIKRFLTWFERVRVHHMECDLSMRRRQWLVRMIYVLRDWSTSCFTRPVQKCLRATHHGLHEKRWFSADQSQTTSHTNQSLATSHSTRPRFSTIAILFPALSLAVSTSLDSWTVFKRSIFRTRSSLVSGRVKLLLFMLFYLFNKQQYLALENTLFLVWSFEGT